MREASVDFRKVTLAAYGKGGQSRKAEKEDNLGRHSMALTEGPGHRRQTG